MKPSEKLSRYGRITQCLRLLGHALLPLFWLLMIISAATPVAYGLFHLFAGKVPLYKLIEKTTQLFLIISIFPAMRALRLSVKDIGLIGGKPLLRQLLCGWMIGVLTISPVLGLLIALDVQRFDAATASLVRLPLTALVSLLLALFIALAEEPLFRGWLPQGLVRKLGIQGAAVISAGYYAALHFLSYKQAVPLEAASLIRAFELVGLALWHWFDAEKWPALLALFCVGLFLNTIRLLFPLSLAFCIGCHAGWVWLIKLMKTFFDANPQSSYAFLASGYDGVVGSLVALWMSGIVWLLWHFRNQVVINR